MSFAFTGLTDSRRLPEGGLIDRTRPIPFTFDDHAYVGFAGDTLASALMANGVRLLGRSFKYHRPRGLLAAGVEEPNALVTLGRGGRAEPNLPATTVELAAGLEASSQNRFPSLRFDLMAATGWLSPLFAAGFYYKTFMWPEAFWERVYEPLIRRAAGLGRAADAPDPDTYDRGHLHADILVIGGGPAGLAAALAAARAGARTILADDDFRVGGRLLAERDMVDGIPGTDWAHAACAELAACRHVRMMTRTSVFAMLDHGTFAAVEHAAPGASGPRQTYWRIVARRAILAAGAFERPLVFPGNDRPGVMLAGAVRSYLHRHAAAPGRRAVVATSGEDGWRTVRDLQAAGIEVAAVIDRRADISPRADTQVFAGAHIAGTRGARSLTAVDVIDGLGARHRIRADMLCMAGGWNPNLALATHTGQRPAWDEAHHAFAAPEAAQLRVVGSAAGHPGLAACLDSGSRAGEAAVHDLGLPPSTAVHPRALPDRPGADDPAPVWLMPRTGKAFVDFQHDVTADDIVLAHREGFRSVEHLKRYTTLGMATDQGKLSNVNGLALMAELTGAGIPATGTTVLRPPYTPVTIGALAGHQIGRDLRPTRLSPAYDWAVGQGAVMIEAGAWLRPGWFPRDGEDWLAACDREVVATRTAAGLCDVSTLGKIELTGPEVGAFLDRLYINTFSTLPVGRVRYGVMLREDGFVFDDGTVARLEPGRWLMTTTTVHAAAVLAHMEFCHQVLWPELDVQFATVTDQWAQFSVAGPRAHAVLTEVLGHDPRGIPYMGATLARAVDRPARLFRISFSGERAWELAVPARHGPALAEALMRAGAPHGLVPYGLEALNAMRIEKGHVAGGELNGQTTARDLGMARMMSSRKDFIGRAMAARPALMDAARPALVGLRPVDPAIRLRGGAHLLVPGEPADAEHDQGWITSAAHSPSLGGWIALAMLKNGHNRLGECIRCHDPIRNEDATATIVAPCFLDPEGERLRDD